jgi:tetratricopeptide (TPR) repeat protein
MPNGWFFRVSRRPGPSFCPWRLPGMPSALRFGRLSANGIVSLRVKNLSQPTHRSLGLAHYIFAAVLLLRLFVLLRFTDSAFLLPNSGDMQFYNEWARQILRGHLTDGHAFYGLPLYAYFLAGLYWLFGYSPFVPGVVQAGLEGGTAVIIYKLAVRVFGHEANGPSGFRYRGECIGIVAALGWAFFVPAQTYAVILMPTAGLVFVFWFVVWQLVSRSTLSRTRVFLLGILIGFTAMGIATILFLVPLLLGAIVLQSTSRGNLRNSWLSGSTAVLLAFAGIGIGTSPCWIHNYFVAKDTVLLSAHSGINFWIGNNPIATGYPRFPPGLRAEQKGMLLDSIAQAESAAGHPLKRSEVSAYWSAKAAAYIKANLATWLKLVATKAANFWNAFQYDDLSIITILSEQGIVLPGPRFGLIAVLAIPGLLISAVRFPLSRWISVAVLLHMVSLLPVFVTERYRLAAVPGLLLGASFGLWELGQYCVRAKYSQAALYCLLLLGAGWFVTRPQKDPGLWALDSYNAGWQALQTDNLVMAEEKLLRAYAYVPENAEINFAMGNLEHAKGNESAAKHYYASSLRLSPRHEGALNNLGVLASQENRWELAAKFFTAVVEINPKDAKAHFLLAKALLEQGSRDIALAEIEQAIILNPAQPEFIALRDKIRSLGAP